jgi:hypothetical protein
MAELLDWHQQIDATTTQLTAEYNTEVGKWNTPDPVSAPPPSSLLAS